MAYLGDKAVGDIVKIKEDGVAVNYIIVHKGKPSDLYDDSCDGVWLLREEIHSNQVWEADNQNDYENSDINIWLNNAFTDIIDEKIRAEIKTVKIPYKKGVGNNSSYGVQSGANGLLLKIFLLSDYEVGWKNSSDYSRFTVDGSKLSYFDSGTLTSSNNKRIAKLDTSPAIWWLRSPRNDNYRGAFTVLEDGSYLNGDATSNSNGIRPAFILPTTLLVDDDGNVTTNNPPTITADKTGDIGTIESGFSCVYSVDDVDESDSVSVTLDLDGTQLSTFTATKNQQETYTLGGDEWLKVTNGEHTFSITASDGKDAATNAITFTRNLTELTVTLAQPFPADDVISACALNVEASIPADAVCKYEVTNNALDTEPVWEDCTKKSQSGFSYVFTNKSAENGFAFNFRVTISRGASGSGGYITSVSGGFE